MFFKSETVVSLQGCFDFLSYQHLVQLKYTVESRNGKGITFLILFKFTVYLKEKKHIFISLLEEDCIRQRGTNLLGRELPVYF